MSEALGQIYRPEIGEGIVAATQRQQGAPFRLHVDWNFPGCFVTETDRALQYGVGLITQRFGVIGKGMAEGEIGIGPERAVAQVEFDVISGGDEIENLYGLGHDLRADAISIQ